MSIAKRLTALLCSAFLLCVLGGGVCAQENLDLSQKGSISLTMKDGDKVVPGGTVVLYRVGEIDEDEDGAISFALVEDFQGSGLDLDDLESSRTAQNLANYAEVSAVESTSQEISDQGEAVFSDLDTGIYLVVQTESNNEYAPVDPFLVSVPQQINGAYVYDVDASPKIELFYGIDVPTPEETPVPETPVPEETPAPETPPAETPPEESTPVESTPVESTPVESTPVESTPVESNPGTPTTTDSGNTKPTLPQTGQLKWPVPVMALTGMMLMGCGFRLRKQDEGENHEA